MRIVDHGKRVIFFCEVADLRQIRNRSVHRKTAIGGDQSKTRILRDAQLRFEIRHIVVLVTEALRFAEANAVNDAGVIQLVTDHRVLIAEQSFK